MWGATIAAGDSAFHISISIHAPRVGSDIVIAFCQAIRYNFNPRSPCGERLTARYTLEKCGSNFNPRSPCGERRGRLLITTCIRFQFQSTLPVWGATRTDRSCYRCLIDFNPRSPCGERHTSCFHHFRTSAFQSTLPVWGATS